MKKALCLLASCLALCLDAAVPAAYVPLEYVTIPKVTSTRNAVATGIAWTDVKRIDFRYATTDKDINEFMAFATYYGTDYAPAKVPYVDLRGKTSISLVLASVEASATFDPGANYTRDGSFLSVSLTTSATATGYLCFGAAWSDKSWSITADWGEVTVYGENNAVLGQYVPCKRLSDDVAGFWDEVSKTFLTKAVDTWPDFVAGPEKARDDYLIVAGAPLECGAPEPGYGVDTNVASGVAKEYAAPTVWTNAEGSVAATCAGWELTRLDGTLVDSGTTTNATVTYSPDVANGTLTWQWKVENRVTASAGEGGSVDVGTLWLEDGDTVAVTATPAEGYAFVGWSGDVAAADKTRNPLDLSVDGAPLSVTAWFEPTSGGDPVAVYLNANAPGPETGTSWACAYHDVGTAIEAAIAKGLPVYAAQGLYLVPSRLAPSSDFVLYGGFSGLSRNETPDDRDLVAHRTVFSGDLEGDDVWVHVEPQFGSYDVTRTTTEFKVVEDGRIAMPAFTGEYDSWVAACDEDNSSGCLEIGADIEVTLDGVDFTGFSYQKTGGTVGPCIHFAKSTAATGKETFVRNCRFIGNYAFQGCVNAAESKKTKHFQNCSFRMNDTISYETALRLSCPVELSGCDFIACSRAADTGGAKGCGGVLYLSAAGAGNSVTRCRFSRCTDIIRQASFIDYSYGGLGLLLSVGSSSAGATFTDCVFSDNASFSLGEYGQPFVNVGNSLFNRCRFENNRYELRPTAGSVYAPFTSRVTGGHVQYDACVFRSNVVAAAAATGTGEYALGLVGALYSLGNQSTYVSLLNTVFDHNEVTWTESAGVAVAASRGILCTATGDSSQNHVSVTGGTFLGRKAQGVVDYLQYGSRLTAHSVLANSVFMVDEDAVAEPFRFDQPTLMDVTDITVKNADHFETEANLTGEVAFDPVIFDEAYRPAVRTPLYRVTADVASNYVAHPASYFAYRPRGGEWKMLYTPLTTIYKQFPLVETADGEGTVRPFGALTRGALQALAPAAETGHTLVLRREPFEGGTFSAPGAVQNVASGELSQPVTVTSADEALHPFAGWYTTNGVLHCAAATLPATALDDDLVLVAKFAAKEQTVTLDLGDFATFDETGLSVMELKGGRGANLPDLPAYTMKPGWHATGWAPALPKVFPGEDLTCRLTAVTKGVRAIRCAPTDNPPAVQDGLTWETAYADFATAYADAAQYRGEVWVREGIHLVDSLPLRSNVAILGGFAGTETSAAEADPAAHPTIFSGDTNGDTFWKPNGSEPPAADRLPVIGAGFVQVPERQTGTNYLDASGANADDSYSGFVSLEQPATNVLFSGVTFVCFRGPAVNAAGGYDALRIRNCAFVACDSAKLYQNLATLALCGDGDLELDGCLFRGCYIPVQVKTARAATNVVRNCVFRDNWAAANAAGFYTSGAAVDVSNCVFRGNFSISANDGNAAGICIASAVDQARMPSRIVDCTFADNRAAPNAHGAVYVSGARAEVARCAFVGNSLLMDTTYYSCDYSAAALSLGSGSLGVRDSAFVSNRLDAVGRTTADPKVHSAYGSVLASAANLPVEFLNCTFEANAVVTDGACEGRFGTFAGYYLNLAFAYCTVADSVFACGGGEIGDFAVTLGDGVGTTVSLFNTVVRNTATGYRPFAANEDYSPTWARSVVSGLDDVSFTPGANGFVDGVHGETPELTPFRTAANGAGARGLSPFSPFVRIARPVWIGEDRHLYFKDEVTDPAKPWRPLYRQNIFYPSAAALGIDETAPVRTDAFGDEAPRRRRTPGALECRRGMAILVR